MDKPRFEVGTEVYVFTASLRNNSDYLNKSIRTPQHDFQGIIHAINDDDESSVDVRDDSGEVFDSIPGEFVDFLCPDPDCACGICSEYLESDSVGKGLHETYGCPGCGAEPHPVIRFGG